jgi:hypothetical protein
MAYQGAGTWQVLPHAATACADRYGQGEIVRFEPVEERSEVSHRHEFAFLREAWANLPEHLASEYPTAEHLRKKALIATGWCDVRDHVCGSATEARRTAAALRGELDDYTVVIVSANVVRVCRAKSQARNRMKKADFQASKTAILEYVAGLLDVAPADLERAAAA